MSRDDFDLDDFGDLEEPQFPEDDDDLLPPEPSADRPRRNTTFLLIAVVLVIIFLLALGAIAFFASVSATAEQTRVAQVQSIQQTNDAIGTAIQGTIIAKSWTPTPSPTPTATQTLTPSPTETPTETPTEAPTEAVLSDIDMTNTKIAMDADNQTATCAATVGGCVGTSFPTLTETPTEVPTVEAGVTLVPTIGPTMPRSGFFEDVAGGQATPANLALIGFATVALVGLIFASRRLRIK
ncbi:MAG: hypothetical protein ABI947_17880 [Chloroflexota bacterium]